jgi:hypothetical protein
VCGTIDIEQPMIHIRLYREGDRYMESADKKEEDTYKIADEQPLTPGVPDFRKSVGLQESIEVITKHSSKEFHRCPLWL